MVKYCAMCAAPVTRAIPQGEDRERDVCPRCGHVHYENPKVVVGCIVTRGDEILLCRRAIEPRVGYWTIPCGFLEQNETLEAGAKRETLEESGMDVAIGGPQAILEIPHISQLYVVFYATLASQIAPPGSETSELMYVTRDKLPWDDLAFPVVRFSLRLECDDYAAGVRRFHRGVVRRDPSPTFDWASFRLEEHCSSDAGV